MYEYVINVFFKMAVKYDIAISDFWELTPKTLAICVQAKSDKLKEDMEHKDILNWQLGQYIQIAVASCLDRKAKYPQKPIFMSKVEEKPLSMREKFEIMASNINSKFK